MPYTKLLPTILGTVRTMKAPLLVLYSYCFAIQVSTGQVRDTSFNTQPANSKYYCQQYQNKKRVAWLLCGTGLTMLAAGAYINILHVAESDTRSPTNADDILLIGGAVATFVSIPLFVEAGKTKKKANLLLKKESLTWMGNRQRPLGFTSVAFTIPL
jgi:hypothetical protein